ncbi:MAG: hypothetical protein CSA81_02760 [Acidobacteria bacterium]|nr:MAG: hypothetical protein CSA81_02760 [Acidobacteriota bacterium]
MTTIIFIAVLIAITYALSSTPQTKKKKKTASFGGRQKRWSSSTRPALPVDKGQMLRCHNCGAFFPESRAIRSQVHDLELHFCSQNCKAHFKVQ